MSTNPWEVQSANLNGEFVNLTVCSAYSNFDRLPNASCEQIVDNEDLHSGLDFNVTKMSEFIHVLRNDYPHCL